MRATSELTFRDRLVQGENFHAPESLFMGRLESQI